MHQICLIAAIDLNNGIGNDNQLLCHLPADLKHFRLLTTGHTVIMGRKTFMSIGRPLPNRQNIVLSSTLKHHEHIDAACSLEEALSKVRLPEPVFIIGGASLFHEGMLIADQMYITRINHAFVADTFFPEINESIWICNESIFQESDEKNPYAITFCHYLRRSFKK